MSRFKLIEIEVNETEPTVSYPNLDINRETEFRVYEHSRDLYGNEHATCILSTPNIVYAKKFLRSCQLIDGIEIKD